MNPEELFRMKQALAQRMALQRLLGGGTPGVGNPYPGSAPSFQMQTPTAMSDSGQYNAADPIPGSQIMTAPPNYGGPGQTQLNPQILYKLMQMFGQPGNQGMVM